MRTEVTKLTAKEEEVMAQFWRRGALFVRELLEEYGEPKPHFNTLSTVVRTLEEKGYLAHRAFGNTHQYYPTISLDEHRAESLRGVIGKYYDNSILSAVSALVKSEKLSSEELRELINMVESQK